MNHIHAFFRSAGACLALFVALNALGDLCMTGFGMDFLWIGFPGALAVPGRLVLLLAAGGLGYAAFRPLVDRRLYIAVEVALFLVALAVLSNVIGFYALLARGTIGSRLPLPSSFLVAAVLAANMIRIHQEYRLHARVDCGETPRRLAISHGLSLAVISLAAPFLFLVAYGTTDYVPHHLRATAQADCIIVYGAGVYADGTPSLSLTDRVGEGIRLYKDGAAPYLVMYGGLNSVGIAEPTVMKRLAMNAGIPEDAIVTDNNGVNTHQTVVRAKKLMASRDWRRSISVSHYYHLLRIKMVSNRIGLHTLTVPARMTRRLQLEPYYLFRECCALYWYYLARW